MKKMTLVAMAFLVAMSLTSQSTHLSGQVDISLSKEQLKSQFVLTKLPEETLSLSFMLHSDLKVKRILLNDQKIKFDKTKERCYDCKVYKLTFAQKLAASDRLLIETEGQFKNYEAGENKKDYKGKIANNYGILRASEQAKWYPVIIDEGRNLPAFLRKFAYTFDLQATCDCRSIYIGRGVPQASGSRFVSERPTTDIMLIAGAYDWFEGQNATFLNIKDQGLAKRLDSLFSSIAHFYESFTKIEMPAKYVLANLPSDNRSWGGFMTYPTIVSVRKGLANRPLAPYLSHEVAHYLFGDVYEPEGNLFWFYLESFAEYMSYKYLLAHQPKGMQGDYKRFKKGTQFVRLDQVKSYDEVSNGFRYLIGPFQLLALEHRIGEEKMMELIATVFPKLKEAPDGYKALIQSLSEIGITSAQIKEIEESIFQRFDPGTYEFVGEQLKAKR